MSVFEEHFGFRENPFNPTPDTAFFFPSEKHRFALDALSYAVAYRKGFVVITGEIGCGKTTVARLLMKKVDGRVKTAFVTNTQLSPKGVLTLVMEDLGVPYRSGSKDRLILQLNAFLLQQMKEGRNVVVVLDEAQNLSRSCLEEIRMLSNFETEKEKLIQIVLIGQPELRQRLEMPELEQLRQRVRVSYHLPPLSREETAEYVRHRLRLALPDGKDGIFEDPAFEEIYLASRGIPRLINTVCEHSLLTAYVNDAKRVSRQAVQEAARELNMGGQKDYEQIYQSA